MQVWDVGGFHVRDVHFDIVDARVERRFKVLVIEFYDLVFPALGLPAPLLISQRKLVDIVPVNFLWLFKTLQLFHHGFQPVVQMHLRSTLYRLEDLTCHIVVLFLRFEQLIKFVLVGPIFVSQCNRVDLVDVVVFFSVTSGDVVDVVAAFGIALLFVDR